MDITANAIVLVTAQPDAAERLQRALPGSRATPVTVLADGPPALAYFFGRDTAGQTVATDGDAVPRLVLLDRTLPTGDGLELLRRLKADPQLRRIPVVVLTAPGEERELARAYALGANSSVVQPADNDQASELLGRIAQYWLRVNRTPPA